MKVIWGKHKTVWLQKTFIIAALMGIALLAISLYTTYHANFYTLTHGSNVANDLILDRIPVVNVDFIFTKGALIFLGILTVVLMYEPSRIPFTLKSIALFTLIRSGFMVLTHISPPLNPSYIDTDNILYTFSSGNDLFFSGHTGLPFLLALIFWDRKYLRYFFLIASLVGGVSVLLGHLHYSIDVFSAFFISFGIFEISKKFFKKDYTFFTNRNLPLTSQK